MDSNVRIQAYVHPKDGPRSLNDLITAALCDPDEDRAWDAIFALHWRGTEEVLDRAVRLCGSPCAVERRLGADILGQLGVPERTFPEECLRTLLGMLRVEADPSVLRGVLFALGHLDRAEVIGPTCRFQNHEDPDVRHAVVLALSGSEADQAIETLITLTRDPEALVRDWATFALGSQVDVDTPEIRQALLDRLADPDPDTRAEAIVGLAERRDLRVLPTLRAELDSDSVGRLAVEAALLLAEPRLHPPLVALRGWWDVDPRLLDEAIEACAPEAAPAPAR